MDDDWELAERRPPSGNEDTWLTPSPSRARSPGPTERSPSKPASWPPRPRAPWWPVSATPSCSPPPTPARTCGRAIDFFPLTVDIEERMYAAGKIPGSFFRREGRADRSGHPDLPSHRPAAAPVVPDGLPQRDPGRRHHLRRRQENPHDVLAINAASAALMLSGIPFEAPSAPCASPTRPRASGSPTRPTRRATRPPSSWWSPAGRRTTRRRRRHHDGGGRRHRGGLAATTRTARPRSPRR